MGEERNCMQTFFTYKAPEGETLPGLFLRHATKMQPEELSALCL